MSMLADLLKDIPTKQYLNIFYNIVHILNTIGYDELCNIIIKCKLH
jgi:hypothetical protein